MSVQNLLLLKKISKKIQKKSLMSQKLEICNNLIYKTLFYSIFEKYFEYESG